MPPLRDLVCQVEWDSPDNLPLPEYNIAYGDCFVESYLAIPRNPTHFVIHLTSHGYVAPGLAMYVFIDGVYQCNRNRRRLLIPGEGVSSKDTEIDFRLRQKESSKPDGTWEGRQWNFRKVNQVDENENASKVGEYDGTIEVVVLRCHHSKPSGKSSPGRSLSVTSSKSSRRSSYVDNQEIPMMTGAIFDGAGDSPPPRHRQRSGKSRERAKKESRSAGGLWGGGENSRPAARGRSRQHFHQEGVNKTAEFTREGGRGAYSGGNPNSSNYPQAMNEQQSSPVLGLRGGAGSEGKRSKKGISSPALSSKSYRLGSGDLPSRTKSPRGSTGSYTPDNTWQAQLPTKSKTGSTHSHTPSQKWESGSDGHRNTQGLIEQNSWTWEPGYASTIEVPTSSSNRGHRKEKQGKGNSTSRHKPGTTTPEDWNSAAENQKEGQPWDIEDNGGSETWDISGKETDRQEHGWDTAPDNSNDQAENGLAEAGRDNNTEWNGNQNDDWNNAIEDGQKDPNGNREEPLDQHDQTHDSAMGNRKQFDKDTWGASVGETGHHSKRRATVGATTSTFKQNAAHKNRSFKASSEAATPAAKLTILGGAGSKATSAASLKSTLKSPLKSWASAKASPRIISDKIVEKVAAIPGAWSPPLEKAEKKTRSESTKRRAAELNAERAKVRAADLDIESPRTRGRRSKPISPLSTGSFKSVSRATTSKRLVLNSKIFQTHRKRPSTIVEESSGDVEVINDDGSTLKGGASSPAVYTHKTCAPHYMDTIADPYAHFVFHYRDMAFISRMCNVTIAETEEQLRSRLANLTKQELLDLLIAEKMAADEAIDENLTWKTSSDKAGYKPDLDAANEKLDEWGNKKTGSGESGQENTDERGDNLGDSNDAEGWDASNNIENDDDENHDNQGGESWGNGSDANPGGTNGGAEGDINNDDSGGNAGWGNSSAQNNGNGTDWDGGNGGDNSGGW